jgi:hypothetical protein
MVISFLFSYAPTTVRGRNQTRLTFNATLSGRAVVPLWLAWKRKVGQVIMALALPVEGKMAPFQALLMLIAGPDQRPIIAYVAYMRDPHAGGAAGISPIDSGGS